MFTILALAFSLTAQAGEVHITLEYLGWAVTVNGERASPKGDPFKLVKTDVGAGSHVVEVKNILGKKMARGTVDIKDNEKVVLKYEKGGLVEVHRETLGKTEPAPDIPVEQ